MYSPSLLLPQLIVKSYKSQLVFNGDIPQGKLAQDLLKENYDFRFIALPEGYDEMRTNLCGNRGTSNTGLEIRRQAAHTEGLSHCRFPAPKMI